MSTESFRRALVFFLLGAATVAHAQTELEPSDEMKALVVESVDQRAAVDGDVQGALDNVMRHVQSTEWAADQQRLKREVAVLTGQATLAESVSQKEEDLAAPEDRLVVFVSSSMPMTTLRNYAKDLDDVDGLLVLRGMVDGMRTMGPTLSFISKVLRVDPMCEGGNCPMRSTNVVIDPVLFRENGISQVPAAVFVENMPLEPYCERFTDDAVPAKARHIVYGDASISHMAAELYRMAPNPSLEHFIKELQ